MGFSFTCHICGNNDPKYIGYRNGKPYCRKCISFVCRSHELLPPKVEKAPIHISYGLSKEQQSLSNKLVENYKHGINTLVHAVCGSGKTEIVLNVIKYAIESGESVGFAIPRRDVVIELFDRLRTIFKDNKVTAVYGGNTEILNGNLIILTTHQLFRYSNYFDLLIIDEIDAFPFEGNDVLENITYRAVKGKLIMMSATPSKTVLKKFSQEGHDIVTLFSRFHKHPLPVPIIHKTKFPFIKLFLDTKRLLGLNKPLFIFCPTIKISENIYKVFSIFFKQGKCVHSKSKNREKDIQDFKNKKLRYLVTTSILERGVTVEGLNLIVYKADHAIYTSRSLVQISGRVGRKKNCPTGEVIYIVSNSNEQVEESIYEIETANKNLQDMF